VEAGDFDFAGLDGFQDSGKQADAGAVAQLGVFETKVANLAQHRAAIGMPV
jgi:hypothetical protein